MLFRVKVQCPSCQGFRCRESRWKNFDEKRAYPDCTPYRCVDCTHRFLKPLRSGPFGVQKLIAAGALVGAVAIIAAAPVLTKTNDEPLVGAQVANVLLDPAIRSAAEAGDTEAQFRLGDALFHDPARTDDTAAEAVRWLQRAAEGGNTDAMIFLGRLSRTGVGILQDFAQASNWIHTAAVRGSSDGMLEMGRLYRDGVGVERDPVMAYVWFNRASAARNLDAVRERDAIARTLTPDELREAQKQSSAAPPPEGEPRVRQVRNP